VLTYREAHTIANFMQEEKREEEEEEKATVLQILGSFEPPVTVHKEDNKSRFIHQQWK
jgi:hypothetical protein